MTVSIVKDMNNETQNTAGWNVKWYKDFGKQQS